MNSIEAAKLKKKENEDAIILLRKEEVSIRRWMKELEEKIETMKKSLADLESSLEQRKAYLAEVQDEKFVLLVDQQALSLFIADGGGLDMFN